MATLGEVFEHVALLGKPGDIGLDPGATPEGGNLVVLASDRRAVDLRATRRGLDARGTGWRIASGDALAAWTGDARVLTDDHAPVDQLLQPSVTRSGG